MGSKQSLLIDPSTLMALINNSKEEEASCQQRKGMDLQINIHREWDNENILYTRMHDNEACFSTTMTPTTGNNVNKCFDDVSGIQVNFQSECVPAKQLSWSPFPLLQCGLWSSFISPLLYLSSSFFLLPLFRIYFLNQASWVSWALGTSLQHIRMTPHCTHHSLSNVQSRQQTKTSQQNKIDHIVTIQAIVLMLSICNPYAGQGQLQDDYRVTKIRRRQRVARFQ